PPEAGADQARLEPIGLAELKAKAACRRAKFRVARAFRKELEEAALLGAEAVARAAPELREDVAIAADGRVDLAAPRGLGRRVANRLVNDVEALGVMDEAAARIDLGVHPRPELDRRLELLRAGKVLFGRCGRRCDGRDEKQAEPRQRISRHVDVP